MLIKCGLFSRQIVGVVCIRHVSVGNIFVSWYFVRNDRCCVAITSLSVSALKSLFRQPQKRDFFTNKLSVLLMYLSRITWFSYFFKNAPNLAFVYCMPFLFASLFWSDWFNSSVTFAALLSVEFLFGSLLLWLST